MNPRRVIVFLTALGLLAGCLVSSPKLLHPASVFAGFQDAVSRLYALAQARDLTFEEKLETSVFRVLMIYPFFGARALSFIIHGLKPESAPRLSGLPTAASGRR